MSSTQQGGPTRYATIFATGIVGALVGAAAAIGMSQWLTSRPAQTASDTAPARISPALNLARSEGRTGFDGTAVALERTAALEHRLAALETQSEPPSAREEPPQVPPAAVATEERKRQVAARIDQAVLAYRQDPRDPSWGPSATASFRTDLEQMAATDGFRLKSIDCRTTQCLAVIEWPSFEQARDKGGDLAHYAYAVNCARHVLQIPPERLDVPSETTVAFDCTDTRANGSASR